MRISVAQKIAWMGAAALLLTLCPSLSAQALSPVNATSLIGKPAPEFIVNSLDGKGVSLGDYKGRAVLVNFWATWCGNCKVEMPWLAQLREKYSAKGFEVLGIVTDGAGDQKIQQLGAKYGVRYPMLRCNHAAAQAYGGLPELPTSFFIDRHGKIVAEMNGADSEQEIEANIKKALGRY